ncbi:MAG: hypothetical protein HY719_12630 [Planctomycetes bacterium]|nr:hypothetical protein [Planctomycetota bacterium]
MAAATAAVAPAPAPPAPAVTPTQTPASEMVAESVAESPAAPASLPAASGEPAPPAPAGGQKAADAVPRRPKPRAKAKAVAAADAEPKGEAEPTVDVAATPAEPVEATEPDARGAEPDPKVDPADAIQMIGWAEARQPGFPYALELQAFYNAHHHHFMVDRAQYARPGAANPGRHPRRERARIEQLVAARAPLAEQGLDKATFNAVMEWGFCRTLPIEEAFLVEVTQDAFRRAAAGDGAGALDDLLSLPLFSIARASLVLAVADPERFAVYDHRVATALSGLRADGKRLFPVPPGRARHCDLLSKAGFVAAYGRYLQAMDLLAEQYRRQHDRPWRVADVEMALSQMGARGVALEGGLAGDPPAEPYGASCFTLGRGAQARRFQATLSTEGIHLKAGEEQVRFDWALIDELVAAKGGQEIAVGAVQKVPADNTLALFLRDHAIDHKWASHLAALLVEAGDARSFRYGGDRMTRLYVRIKEAGEN